MNQIKESEYYKNYIKEGNEMKEKTNDEIINDWHMAELTEENRACKRWINVLCGLSLIESVIIIVGIALK